jgi:hypothetical protein
MAMIELVALVAANLTLSPLDLAVNPEIQALSEVAASVETQKRGLKTSVNGTTCYIGGNTVIDDWNTWD